MILYADTSALIKLHIVEGGSAQVVSTLARAETVATSLLTYVEARSALARRRREGDLTPDGYGAAVAGFEADWEKYFVMAVSPYLVRAAGDMAEQHGLRAVDSLHLASADLARALFDVPLVFLSADRRLTEAAQAEGLEVELVGTEGQP